MVIVIDANHLASRTYYAISELTTSNGKHVNCIYGFVDSFRSIFKRFKDPNTYFILAWDGPGKKRGHELDPDYKGDRSASKDNFKAQLEDLRHFISLLGIKQYRLNNIEADDIIGTLAIKARKQGHKVKIISADHDFEQLITKHITVIKPAMGKHDEEIRDPEYVVNKYGIEPNQIVEMLSLAGDGSDNIKGIEKCGDITACRLLRANGSLDNVLENIETLKTYNKKNEIVNATEKFKDKVRNAVDKVRINKQIVTLDCNIDIDFVLNQNKPNFDKLQKMFEELEFEKYLNNFEKWKADLVV